jgi:hypothetical protein
VHTTAQPPFGFHPAHGRHCAGMAVSHSVTVRDLKEPVFRDDGADLDWFEEYVETGIAGHCESGS